MQMHAYLIVIETWQKLLNIAPLEERSSSSECVCVWGSTENDKKMIHIN